MKKMIFVLLFATNLFGALTTKIAAQEPMIAEIRMFAGNFAPTGWAFCNGQLLPIAQNQALFSLIGTTYGGDGQTTFALPDLRGRVPRGVGNSPSGFFVTLGEQSGTESKALSQSNMPTHSHTINIPGSTADGDTNLPTNAIPANTKILDKEYSTAASDTTMKSFQSGLAGGSAPFSTMDPYTGITFIIALQGIYPTHP